VRERERGGGEAFNEKESSVHKAYIEITKHHHKKKNLVQKGTENLAISCINLIRILFI
jgi:hypothetical protein